MEYAIPQFDLKDVDEAGALLAFDEGTELSESDWNRWLDAYTVVDNWRLSHHYPLNAMAVVLKFRARRIQKNALAFQRLKRLQSILYKLRVRKWITLSQMQDLGGCRAVMSSVENVYKLRDLYFSHPLSHRF
ncbi:MAG TPA: hypothetical protein VGP71_12600, partial [Burkholderiales bacterium]|nr:hypothetical protein [Burkholderiales bacterium]